MRELFTKTLPPRIATLLTYASEFSDSYGLGRRLHLFAALVQDICGGVEDVLKCPSRSIDPRGSALRVNYAIISMIGINKL